MFENIYQQIITVLPSFSGAITLLLALLLDKTLGEAKKFHYLVGFGWLATKVESTLNLSNKNENTPRYSSWQTKLLGLLAWCVLVSPLPIFYYLFIDQHIGLFQIVVDAIVLYLAIGLNSLHQHAMQIYRPLKADDITAARYYTGYIVSRETKALNEQEISRATVESMLENGHDSVIASLFYFIIGGAPLVILHRFTNTLDAMWGYKNSRYIDFGYASARLDDALGYLSGKYCTLLYAIQGIKNKLFIKALRNAYQQGNQYKSHNGGWVMAAGATVMNIKLGGSAQYHGNVTQSVILGDGKAATIKDIPSSLAIVRQASLLVVIIYIAFQLLR